MSHWLTAALIETSRLNIKLQFNASRGFFLTLPADQLKGGETDLPPTFINVVKKKKLYSFTTIELVKYIVTDWYYWHLSSSSYYSYRRLVVWTSHLQRFISCQASQYLASLVKCHSPSQQWTNHCSTVTELLERFHADIGVLYKVTEAIAMLDMLLSFAHSCSLSQHGMCAYIRHAILLTIQSKLHSATWIHINTCHWSWSSSDYGAYAKRTSSAEWHFRITIIEFSNHYWTQHEWKVNLHQTSGFTYYYGAYGILCSCILCIISALWPGM